MDLNNLTLDELLERIKAADSGAQPQEEKPAETAAVPTVKEPEIIYEPAPAAEVSSEKEEEPAQQAFYVPVKSEATEPIEIIEEPSDISFEPQPIVQSNVPIEVIEDAPEPFDYYEEQKPSAAMDFSGIFPKDEDNSELDPQFSFVSLDEIGAGPKPAEIAVPDYSAGVSDFSAEEKFAIFGNIDIDSDVSALFDDKVTNSIQDNGDSEKTIVFEKVDSNPVYERPGIITGKNLFEKTADLKAVPAILTAEEMLREKKADEEKTFIRTGNIPIVSKPASQPVRHEDSQMVLPGFETEAEPVEQVDESLVEDELRKSRSKKVDSFRLQGILPEETQPENDFEDEPGAEIPEKPRRFSLTKTRSRLNRQEVEYNKAADKAKVSNFISHKKLSALVGTVVSAVCTLALLIINCIPSVSEGILTSSAQISVLAAVSCGLLAVAFGAALPCCISGISCFFNGSGKPNSQTPVFLAAVTGLIQALLLTFLDSDGELVLFAPAAALVLCLGTAGKLLAYNRIESNFRFLSATDKNSLYTVGTIDNVSDANKIGRNVVMGDADIRYSAKTGFTSNFLAYSLASDAADDLCIKLVPITAVASLVIGIIAAITSKDVLCGFSLFAGAMCMGAPASAVIAANLPLTKANNKLREDGGIITGYAGAFEYESTNAVALDAAELFPGHCCNIHGMKTFYGVRIDDAILTAASMLIEAGGPISSLFNEVVMGRKELLMNVEELIYEDRLGLSGWIRGRRIFVGNRKLLENHNIEIPMSVDEAKYRHDGRRVIYLADAGKIAAIFVVSYGSLPSIAEHLRKTENNGINILIRTTDSNITEEFVANTFGLPLNSVKIVSTNAGEVLKSYSERVLQKAEAKLIHNGSAAALLNCVSKASSLCSIAGIISTQQTFCTAAGLLLMVIMVIFSGAINVSSFQICICQLIWLAIGTVVPLINRE